MSTIKATYLIPTTTDRGPLLKHLVDSILRQTIPELEVFIIGDGVNNLSRTIIKDICKQDARVLFFDHKKHSRRGEPYRHEALKQARGEIVCYACDRDLLLPNHLELMWKHTREHNFVNINSLNILPNGIVNFGHRFRPSGRAKDHPKDLAENTMMFLSTVSHTLDLYRSLPIGWDTTPENDYTDQFMWRKFINHLDTNIITTHTPGTLYFKRGHHPGWTTEERLADIQQWLPYASDQELILDLIQRAQNNILNERVEMVRHIEHLKHQIHQIHQLTRSNDQTS